MKAFDFFCGAGGLTRGLLDAGIKVIAGFDYDKLCKTTYEFNNPGVKFVTKNIREIDFALLKKYTRNTPFKEMLFSGCAPCQPFSPHRKGFRRVKDGTLLSEFGRLVKAARPGYVLIENVPGLARVPGYSTFRRFLRLLEESGYNYEYNNLDAKYYGVPQSRRRLVLIATLKGNASLPKQLYGSVLRPFETVRRAISHYPPLQAGQSDVEVPNHVTATITAINQKRLKFTPHDGGDRLSWPENLYLDCHKGKHNGHTDVYGRMAWDSPAPTLTGRCNSISNGRYGHPCQDRAISLREAAALQSFPDGYIFFGSNKHIALQVGNAVPVRLAEVLGKHILNMDKDSFIKRCGKNI